MRAFASKKKLLSKRKLATWSKQYMTWQQTIDDEKEDAYEEGLAEGREAGRAEGISQKAVEAAENLLRMGMGTDDQISMAIGLPLEQVKEIAERIGNS